MKTKNRERLLAFVAIAAVAILIGDRLILSPLLSSWKDRSASIGEFQQRLENGRNLLDRETTYRNRWQIMQRDSLPQTMSIAENAVLSAVDRWARGSRIHFTSIKPQWRVLEDDQGSLLECRAGAYGNLEEIARFLFALETDPLPIRIEEVEMVARDERGDQLNLAVRFTGLQLVNDR